VENDSMMMGYISFDALTLKDDQSVVEGCYSVDSKNWVIFYFTKWWNGDEIESPIINKDAVFKSGSKGINVEFPKSMPLNEEAVRSTLSVATGISEWKKVRGPDSLSMK
jgi:hypothetical protein